MNKFAMQSGWREEETLFNNHYQCPHCGEEWQDVWACQVDEDCPACDLRHISPVQSDEL